MPPLGNVFESYIVYSKYCVKRLNDILYLKSFNYSMQHPVCLLQNKNLGHGHGPFSGICRRCFRNPFLKFRRACLSGPLDVLLTRISSSEQVTGRVVGALRRVIRGNRGHVLSKISRQQRRVRCEYYRHAESLISLCTSLQS